MATSTIVSPPLSLSTAIPVPVAPPEDKFARRPKRQIPAYMIKAAQATPKEDYAYERHVNFQPPSKSYSLEELGQSAVAPSPHAISEPFPLFTEECVAQMRRELFSDQVLEKHQYESSFIKNLIRGHCPQDAPFITNVWRDPKLLANLSSIAGIDLVPSYDYEIGNVNISWTGEGGDAEVCKEQAEALVEASSNDDQVGWHFDSMPFVCVTMLSDCTDMVGGETMIKTGRGDYMKVRGPAMGTAVVMQGRYLAHKALRALGKERIAMVTSFRPKSSGVKDDTVLTGVRGISDVPRLYYEYAQYRYQNLSERFAYQKTAIDRLHETKQSFNLADNRRFLEEQKAYIDAMLAELYEVS